MPPLTAQWHGEVTHGPTVISPSTIFPLARRSVAPSGYINTASKGRSKRGYGLGGRHLPPTASHASDIVALALRPGQSAGGTFHARWHELLPMLHAQSANLALPCALAWPTPLGWARHSKYRALWRGPPLWGGHAYHFLSYGFRAKSIFVLILFYILSF